MTRIVRPEHFPPHSHERQLVQELTNQHGAELASQYLVAVGFTPEQLLADELSDGAPA